MTEEKTFEKAFDRLEEILQHMNEGKISLDSSLKLFEEADELITQCNKKLTNAEQKIETLIKKRDSQLEIDGEKPKTKAFEYDRERIMED